MTGGGSSSTTPPPPPSSSPSPSTSTTTSPLSTLRTTISHPHQQVTLTCYIPPSKIGAVIGRGGKTIINLQREASRRSNHPNPIRMSVASNNSPAQSSSSTTTSPSGPSTDGPTELWTPVIIRGDPVGCFAAAGLLMPLVEDEMDDVVMDIPIQRSKHSAIIGRKGGTIAILSADHNVRIMVPSGNNRSGNNNNGDQQPLFSEKENLNMIQLEGDVNDVERCLIKLLQVVTGEPVSGDNNTGANPTPASGGSSSTNGPVEKIVTAPAGRDDLVPSLAKLRQIGKKTNTIVRRKRVERDNGQDVETQFIISGRGDCVDAAVTLFGKMFVSEESSGSSGHHHHHHHDRPEAKEEQKKPNSNNNSSTQGNSHPSGQNVRGRGKGGRGGRGGGGRGNNSKPFSQRGGRGRGASSSSSSSTPPTVS